MRTRLPSDQEVDSLVSEGCSTGKTRCDNDIAAIRPLIRFIVYTGCRLGEALHLEWDDIEEGVWQIRGKPNRPTANGMGWAPKWGMARSVHLFPEALEVLETQLRNSRWVFPKPDVSRRDSVQGSWERLKELHGLEDFQITDLRTWISHVLKKRFGFTTKEVDAYIGHSSQVNESHYDPISLDLIVKKMGGRSVIVTQLLPERENFTGPGIFGLVVN